MPQMFAFVAEQEAQTPPSRFVQYFPEPHDSCDVQTHDPLTHVDCTPVHTLHPAGADPVPQ